ncbi:MAG: hypothetical protein ACE5FP_10425 [Gemmatimonadota bacterium]
MTAVAVALSSPGAAAQEVARPEALEGATLMLQSATMRRTSEDMVKRIEHVELETTPDFFDIFVEGCRFVPMQRTLT